ncbi:MAG: bifunctional diguanylate cyclase/phosphodiesterase [Lachnospiraceae bacterium]|nr:bifunctional diguanylate cyclase/phosphodiesterase [Lachnospiraceae bacterium]
MSVSLVEFEKAYQKFFQNVPEDGVTMVDMMQYFGQNIAPVAQALEIARLEVCLQAPRTRYDADGKNERMTVYEEADYADTPIEKVYNTGEKGVASFLAYPKKGTVWNSEETEKVEYLIKNIYFICGRTRIMEMMSRMTITDHLTGLPNNPGLVRYCNMLISKGELTDFTAIFLNLKNYKYINQRMGSDVGNDVMYQYAQAIHSLLKEKEIIARMGGDNFVAIIKNENLNTFLQEIKVISVTVEQKNNKYTFDISPRAGIYPIQAGDTMSDILDYTSIAMTEAKNSLAEDFLYFRLSMLENAVYRKEIANNLPHAIQEREFVVYYQPKVLLDDNTLYGCEALVRWLRNGRMIPPMDFIPVLEQEGFVCQLDFYVLDTVCRDIRSWLDAGIEPVRVSVNFLKIHLYNKNLSQDILDVLEKYHIDSKYIEIELTETTGYEDLNNMNRFVNAMKENGITTSLDDFGTGYSSLNLLKDLDVDIIKLDGSFLTGLNSDNKEDEVVIKNIVKMIHDLNMQVVAEGVETSEQAEYLRSIQCHLAQGFLFDRPLPHDEFERCLTGEKSYSSTL